MIHRAKRIASMTLVLVLVLSVLAGAVPAHAATGEKLYNPGTRNETCTSLSAQANAYYTGEYTWEHLSSLEGGSSDCTDTDNALFDALNKLMTDTMQKSVTYTNLKKEYPYSDAIGGSDDNYGMFYSGATYTSSTDSALYNTISREHVWPKSHATFHEKNGGCDLHHLRPEYAQVNSARNNYILGNVNGVYNNPETYTYNGSVVFYKYGSDKTSDGRCEIPDSVKGDVARILLYVWCRWEQPNLFMDISDPQVDTSDNSKKNQNDGIRVIESLETLLQWCKDDPVDTWEMGRNDATERIQGNRNVFVDYPELAWLAFGQNVPADVVTPSGHAGTPDNCTHQWGEGQVTVSASCTKEGTKSFTCSICGETKTQSIPATGSHSFGKWTQTKAPTSGSEGAEERTCVLCGEKQTRTIEKLDGFDLTTLILIGVVLVLLLIGALTLPRGRKKKRKTRKKRK